MKPGPLAGLRAQLAASGRLRMGLLAVLALAWIYALLTAGDAVQDLTKRNAEMRAELERLTPLARERGWSARVDEVRRQRDALDVMLWTGTDAGLAEAALQDWLRASATKWGVAIRSIELVRETADAAPRAVAGSAANGPSAAPALPAGIGALRVRVASDLKPIPLLGWLSEIGQSERVVMVERLAMRTAAQPGVAELDLRVLTQTGSSPKGPR